MTDTIVDIQEIKDELLNFFRDKLNPYDPRSRITVVTSLPNAETGQTIYSLSPTRLSFVRSVSINGTNQAYGEDYEIVWRDDNKGSINFLTHTFDGTETISVVWGRKKTDVGNFVYPDFPKRTLSAENYPRIGFMLIDNIKPAGLGGGKSLPYEHSIRLSVKVVSIGNTYIDQLITEIRKLLAKYSKSFHTFHAIIPEPVGSYTLYEDEAKNVLSKTVDFIIPYELENIEYI